MKLGKKKEEKKTESQKIEERRKEVLKKGRSFKYPLQFTKHAVVVWTIVISVVAVIILGVLGWAALYKFQNTDEFFYRVTQVLPVSVARVDERNARYSDYLMFYRSSMTAETRQTGSLDEESLKSLEKQYKRSALTQAEEYAYAEEIAESHGITVSDEEVEEEFLRHQKMGGSERSREAFLKIIEDNFDLSEREYLRILRLSLIRKKVEQEIDTKAKKVAEEVQAMIEDNDGDMTKVAEEMGDKVIFEETGGMVSSQNVDGGRAAMADSLEEGEVSERFLSSNGDGYYFVKLIEKGEGQVNFQSIKIEFSEFETEFQNLVDDGRVVELIQLEA